MADLIEQREKGLYCAAGDFWIDPWEPVDRAVITHAHSDHAKAGHQQYLAMADGVELLRLRLGDDIRVRGAAYGERVDINGVQVSLHPAGHMLGSAQVRVEHKGQVAVVSGDYKVRPDPTCPTFEPVRCGLFISEATFALPIYSWPDEAEVFADINAWWRGNQAVGKTSVLFSYALGKAQRLLAEIDASIGPIYAHGALMRYEAAYAAAGVHQPGLTYCEAKDVKAENGVALVMAPPSAFGTPWMRKLGKVSTAFASGWMTVRGRRRQRGVDRGFILSDHADWNGLIEAITATGAEKVLLTHGYSAALARWLREMKGLDAATLMTQYGDEDDDAEISSERAAS